MTDYTLQMKPVDLNARCPAELLEAMRQIYMQYTGSEVAEAIKAIRMEIEEYRESVFLDEYISILLQRSQALQTTTKRTRKSPK